MNIKSYDFYYALRTLPFIKAIYLYGSRAKGTQQERSDVDLAILCPNASQEDWLKVSEIIEQADTLLHIDCIRLDQLKDFRLKQEINESKVVLFERKDNSFPWYEMFLDLGEAIERFEDALKMDNLAFPYSREAVIHIFEYSFELFWKLLKKMCLDEGFEVYSPRSALQKSYVIKLIDDESSWLEMMEDRNLTSHTYKQSTAQEIFEHAKIHSHTMRAAYEQLKRRYNL